ncbi:hypothetical protein [Streptomyces sp. NPDC055085]
MTGEAGAANREPCRSMRLHFNPALCHVKNVKYHGLVQGKKSIAVVQGRGPMTLTLTAMETVSNTESATITVAAGAVSGAVGFDVTKSRTKSMAGSWNVPRGKFGTLKAYPLYQEYSFNVYSKITGESVGKGTARKAIGYRYKHSVR